MTDRTNAERQRRFIERLKARAAAEGVTNATDTGEVAALKKELAQARARIAEMTRERSAIAPEALAPSAQAKLEVAKRAMERKLNDEHAARMRSLDDEIRQRVLKESAEHLAMLHEAEAKAHESEKWYRELIDNHKPPFTPDEFKTILMCLHPDGERTAEKLNEAFRLFNSRKFQLTGVRLIKKPHK